MKVTAPGKLMLSGEWSVLEDGVPCVVMAINQKVSVDINSNDSIVLSAKGTDFKANAKFENNSLLLDADDKSKEFFLFVAKSVEASLKYLSDEGINAKSFSIETNSSDTVVTLPNGQKAKVGFGSSAAIVAATVAAVLSYHGQEIKSIQAKQKIFKLGCIAHYLAQGKIGSSFDVAASTFGGALVYQKPDMKWVTQELTLGKKISELVNTNWPLLMTEPITLPIDFNLSIGFVGNSASTKELILKLNTFKTEKKNDYDKIIANIKQITEKLINAIKTENKNEILNLLKENRVQLKLLSDESQNNLETKELALLSDIANKFGGAGKFSGAGGGDCGIAITFDKETKQKIENEWSKNNITPILVGISFEGVEC
jgi:phosphomevalonate kinase